MARFFHAKRRGVASLFFRFFKENNQKKYNNSENSASNIKIHKDGVDIAHENYPCFLKAMISSNIAMARSAPRM